MKYKSKRKKKKRNRKIYRSILIFLLIVVLFIKGCFVSAGENDSVLSKNRVDGVYAIAKSKNDTRLYYLNMYSMNGRVAYCIDLGTDIVTDTYHSTADFKLSKLTRETIEYIRAISYFGYLYKGHESYYYYMASQELIWEYISNVDISWTNEESVDGAEIDLLSYKLDILRLREKYYGGLLLNNFANNSVYKIGDTIYTKDYSGLLSEYEVISEGHSKVEIDGDYLKINIGDSYVGKEEIKLQRKNFYSYDSTLYYYDNSQKLISNGNFMTKINTISFYIEGNNLDFIIKDSNTNSSTPTNQSSFDGIVYELYDQDNNFIEDITFSDEIVEYNINNLAYGDYIIRQKSTNSFYEKNDEDILIHFDATTSLPIELIVNPKYQNVSFFKVYNFNNEGVYKEEEGISFTICDVNNLSCSNILTDEKGIASIDLTSGYYVVHQNNTTYGYDMIEDFEIEVNPDKEKTKRYDLVNNFISCQLQIKVVDSILNINAGSGFLFKIWDYSKKEYLEFDKTKVFSTNEDGVLLLPIQLGYGKYSIEQVGVPINFKENNTDIEITINENSNFLVNDDKLQLEYVFLEEHILARIKVLTEEELFNQDNNEYSYSFQPRDNIKVSLITNDDITINNNILYEKGTIIDTIITDKKGEAIIDNLELGSYCLIEEDTKIKECFELSILNKKNDQVFREINLRYLLDKMNIVISNKNNQGYDIKGSIMEVKNKDGQVIYAGMTNNEGIIKVKSLPSGEYCIKQKQVNNIYKLNNNNICIKINNTKLDWNVEVLNELSSNKWINIPNTLDYEVFDFRVLLIFVIGIGVFVYYKKIR